MIRNMSLLSKEFENTVFCRLFKFGTQEKESKKKYSVL